MIFSLKRIIFPSFCLNYRRANLRDWLNPLMTILSGNLAVNKIDKTLAVRESNSKLLLLLEIGGWEL